MVEITLSFIITFLAYSCYIHTNTLSSRYKRKWFFLHHLFSHIPTFFSLMMSVCLTNKSLYYYILLRYCCCCCLQNNEENFSSLPYALLCLRIFVLLLLSYIAMKIRFYCPYFYAFIREINKNLKHCFTILIPVPHRTKYNFDSLTLEILMTIL